MSCNKLSFEECELAILRSAVDKIDKKKGKEMINNPEVDKIIKIVENFLKKKKLVCYGGTAINNILPRESQFYDKSIELPDYDFFSPTPLKHAKQLADLYYSLGFTEVEAKAGMHAGTFKVFVNYIPVADITYLVEDLYKIIKKKAIKVDNILYSAPNYLRMLMYLELSRPSGDVSRWEKVLKRLTLLNKHYPLVGQNCGAEEIQRIFEIGAKRMKLPKKEIIEDLTDGKNSSEKKTIENIQKDIFENLFESLVDQGCIFFGAYANRLYYKTVKYGKKSQKGPVKKIPDFDVLAEEPVLCAKLLKKKLQARGYEHIRIINKQDVGEVIAPHIEFRVSKETALFIYKPIACHSYNIIKMSNKKVRIATIDTMLSFYLAFLFVKKPYYEENRILCMCEFLFKAQQKNRLRQRGLLKRFSIDCYGKQLTKEKMRAEKSDMYYKLKDKRKSKMFHWYFLRYIPHEANNKKIKLKKPNKKSKNKTFKKIVKKRVYLKKKTKNGKKTRKTKKNQEKQEKKR